ncbi:hypothetical protein PAPYR_12249 [Paratrimastix pyriformis]|uniref:Uncharacterized protein n=1 Tax=Paratrimastix pyriformis TaxID=342808 RepID=A0ABQ8U4R8_9EUKA|nr:hypothetical protein PAPYR_12249 [Paratrimastix pyriformis]
MWQANLTEWYEENPDGDNLKKEENPAVGDNLKKEENPPSGTTSRAALGDIGWVDTMEKTQEGGQPQEGGKPRRRGQPQGASLGAIGWVGTDTEEENPRGQPQEGGKPR